MLKSLSRLRVLEISESRDVRPIYAAVGSDHIDRLEPVQGSDRRLITVGTETDSVTLSLSEADFDALSELIHRLEA